MMAETVEMTCLVCGTKFSATVYEITRRGRKACSILCRGQLINLRLDPLEEFEKRWIPEPNSGCWLWLGTYNFYGYGLFHSRGKQRGAHRFSWEFYRGPIPEGMHVLHHCDNPSCVNPDHLFIGTHQDNMADKTAKGRTNPLRGEECKSTKLTNEDALNIFNSKLSVPELSKAYGTSHTTIYTIRRGESWKHIHA